MGYGSITCHERGNVCSLPKEPLGGAKYRHRMTAQTPTVEGKSKRGGKGGGPRGGWGKQQHHKGAIAERKDQKNGVKVKLTRCRKVAEGVDGQCSRN